MQVTAFTLPKRGNDDADNDDAFRFLSDIPDASNTTSRSRHLRAAVADGATESSFSGYWAALLAESYCLKKFDCQDIAGQLNHPMARWNEFVSHKKLPWYAEEKAQNGAFAALVGLRLTQSCDQGDEGPWEAFAIGDSCLFQIRNGAILKSLPLTSFEQFSNNPYLLSSNTLNNDGVLERIEQHSGDWQRGDAFFLMSDAISCWFLRTMTSFLGTGAAISAHILSEQPLLTVGVDRVNERDLIPGWERPPLGRLCFEPDHTSTSACRLMSPTEVLMTISCEKEFADFVSYFRSQKDEDGLPLMRNDDVTLVRILID